VFVSVSTGNRAGGPHRPGCPDVINRASLYITIPYLLRDLLSLGFRFLPHTFGVIGEGVQVASNFTVFALDTGLDPFLISTTTTPTAFTPFSPRRPLSSEVFHTAVPHLHILTECRFFGHILIIADVSVERCQFVSFVLLGVNLKFIPGCLFFNSNSIHIMSLLRNLATHVFGELSLFGCFLSKFPLCPRPVLARVLQVNPVFPFTLSKYTGKGWRLYEILDI